MKISSFYINNYRSLVNFKVEEFDSTTIFYGENNAGKSNILNALYTIFQRKKKSPDEEPQNFYEGIIENFSNNFFNNTTTSIDFNVGVEIGNSELTILPIISKIIKSKPTNNISIIGNIVRQSQDAVIIVTKKIIFNKSIIFSVNGAISYFPSFKGKSRDEGLLSEAFTNLINPLNDCVSIINSNRDMHESKFLQSEKLYIDQNDFKNFLHSLYLSEQKNILFEKINSVFNSEPFKFGEISFSRQGDLLELMIKEDKIRLPIKHLGSGVLQTLYIIASIIYNRHKIICIEELEQNLSPIRQNLTLRKLQTMLNNNDIGDLQQIILSSHSTVFSKDKLGFIYFLEKSDGITIVKEVKPTRNNIKSSKSLKKYFFPAALENDSYTPKEWADNIEENKQRGEILFNR
jgi:predicted ATP-dependent endonuclease of OLD family